MQDVKINKEIQNYKEKILFGLFDVRETICLSIGVVLAVITYRLLPMPMSAMKLFISCIPVFPLGIIGFFEYNKMPGEELLGNIIKFYFLNPRKYPSVTENRIYDDKVKRYMDACEKISLQNVKEKKEIGENAEDLTVN